MPKLEVLLLGDVPCHRILTGVTTKGLAVLAHHCLNLSALRIHFQVTSLSASLASPEITLNAGSSALRMDCAWTEFAVGEIPAAEESASTVALTLLRIFPRIKSIEGTGKGWAEVENVIRHSR